MIPLLGLLVTFSEKKMIREFFETLPYMFLSFASAFVLFDLKTGFLINYVF